MAEYVVRLISIYGPRRLRNCHYASARAQTWGLNPKDSFSQEQEGMSYFPQDSMTVQFEGDGFVLFVHDHEVDRGTLEPVSFVWDKDGTRYGVGADDWEYSFHCRR